MYKTIKKITVVLLASALGFASAAKAEPLKEIKLDYAYYSPQSLVIKRNGWLEQEFKAQGVKISWVFSRGSNNSLEFLNSGASNFALTSGISALVARTNGQPVKAVYSFQWSEPSALVVTANSPIRAVADIKGRKVAATKGTDPYFFLLRTFDANSLKPSDVEIVHLQHPEGRTALEQGRVDVWAGLDPHMAAAQNGGARFVYRNPAFGLGAFLNTSESFLSEQPQAVRAVLKAYERARRWIVANPKQAAELVAEETKLPVEVIALQMGRYSFDRPVPGAAHIEAIKPVIPLLRQDGILRRNADVDGPLNTLIDARIAADVVAEK
ncbi:sulfonate transport system substrate-binding protein [Paucimonas lemoignei]|uniref:Putative aliphatic sulfonates-binding protein n=1 Tax=Paucimonas lemoignei TaxID=29443 RepID=A0A4R3HUC2_PAULE|nr:aliphatic sulfonate ABC transporter substrate-binding protein [Paucimonas lemoignei]TCS36638.1 sulfonate transport system substrate-binding protein [Paucimonas lemoignei]